MTKWEGHILNAACAAARLGQRVLISYGTAGFTVTIDTEVYPIEEAVARCLVRFQRDNNDHPRFEYSVQAGYALGSVLYEGVA